MCLRLLLRHGSSALVAVALSAAICLQEVRICSAHRDILKLASCGPDFANSSTALPVLDASKAWTWRHYFDCSAPVVWAKFVNPTAELKFHLALSLPVLPRFADLRANIAIIGPGLPKLSSADLAALPGQVRNDAAMSASGNGALVYRSPQDQSSCAHIEGAMKPYMKVVDGRCYHFDMVANYGRWHLLEKHGITIPTIGGKYWVATWLQADQSGKLEISLGTMVEDYLTPVPQPSSTCRRMIVDYSEEAGDQSECLPAVQCPAEIPVKTSCVAQGACAGCRDDVLKHLACQMDGYCNCSALVQAYTCNGTFQTSRGALDVTAVCKKTCKACRGTAPYTPQMVCGGAQCPEAARMWDKASMDMHHGMAINFTCDPEVDFVRGMIPHHQGAVDMCKVLVNVLTCPEDGALDGLVEFCRHVWLAQEIEIDGMNKWLADNGHDQLAQCSDAMAGTMGGSGSMDGHMHLPAECGELNCSSSRRFMETNELMHGGMAVDLTCSHDVDFVRGMIPHHMGAVVMCDIMTESVSKSGRAADPFLNELCSNITTYQRAEIAWLSKWLAVRGHAPLAPCTACTNGASVVQPSPPCEDTLPASSFCHTSRGLLMCSCKDVVKEHACGSVVEIANFGRLDVSAECARTCGKCGDVRPPLLGDYCAKAERGMSVDSASGIASGADLWTAAFVAAGVVASQRSLG